MPTFFQGLLGGFWYRHWAVRIRNGPHWYHFGCQNPDRKFSSGQPQGPAGLASHGVLPKRAKDFAISLLLPCAPWEYPARAWPSWDTGLVAVQMSNVERPALLRKEPGSRRAGLYLHIVPPIRPIQVLMARQLLRDVQALPRLAVH